MMTPARTLSEECSSDKRGKQLLNTSLEERAGSGHHDLDFSHSSISEMVIGTKMAKPTSKHAATHTRRMRL
eukprot:4487201-Pleurochrysis_carterae.AAC.1